MWRRPAPRARRSPISPTRSSTETRVTLAMPMPPTSSDTPPRIKNRALTFSWTSARRSSASGGACTRTVDGSSGDTAIGPWAAISAAAPTSVRIWMVEGDCSL